MTKKDSFDQLTALMKEGASSESLANLASSESLPKMTEEEMAESASKRQVAVANAPALRGAGGSSASVEGDDNNTRMLQDALRALSSSDLPSAASAANVAAMIPSDSADNIAMQQWSQGGAGRGARMPGAAGQHAAPITAGGPPQGIQSGGPIAYAQHGGHQMHHNGGRSGHMDSNMMAAAAGMQSNTHAAAHANANWAASMNGPPAGMAPAGGPGNVMKGRVQQQMQYHGMPPQHHQMARQQGLQQGHLQQGHLQHGQLQHGQLQQGGGRGHRQGGQMQVRPNQAHQQYAQSQYGGHGMVRPPMGTNGAIPPHVQQQMMGQQMQSFEQQQQQQMAYQAAQAMQTHGGGQMQHDGNRKRKLEGEAHSQREPRQLELSDIPVSIEVQVPPEGLRAGQSYEAQLPNEKSDFVTQLVRVTATHACAAAATPGKRVHLTLDENTLFKVELRGGREQWVTRKKLETILRNRKSAAASRKSIVELKDEVKRLRLEVTQKDEQLNKVMQEVTRLSQHGPPGAVPGGSAQANVGQAGSGVGGGAQRAALGPGQGQGQGQRQGQGHGQQGQGQQGQGQGQGQQGQGQAVSTAGPPQVATITSVAAPPVGRGHQAAASPKMKMERAPPGATAPTRAPDAMPAMKLPAAAAAKQNPAAAGGFEDHGKDSQGPPSDGAGPHNIAPRLL